MATSTINSNFSKLGFKSGETVSLSFCYGYITNSGKTLNLLFPMASARVVSGSPQSLTSSFKIAIRHCNGGYVKSQNYDVMSDSSLTKSVAWYHGYIRIQIVNSSGWGLGNMPVAGSVDGGVVF